jgi:hypothetical protein
MLHTHEIGVRHVQQVCYFPNQMFFVFIEVIVAKSHLPHQADQFTPFLRVTRINDDPGKFVK